MGLFSGTKEVSVSSVVYNMAGAEELRPDYLKSLVVRNVLSGTKDSISQTLQNGYLRGPAMQFRSFFRWAAKPANYGQVGMPTGQLAATGAVNAIVVQDAITRLIGQSTWVQRAIVRDAEYGLWVEQWLLLHHPEAIDTAWTADISATTGLITVTFVGGATESFLPADFDFTAKYLYAWYTVVTGNSLGPLIPGELIELGTDDFPSLSGWTFQGETTTPSGGTTVTELVYTRDTFLEATEDGPRYRRDILHLFETVTEDPGTGAVTVERSYRIDSQTYTGLTYQQVQLYIYRIGTGQADLDALVQTTPSGQFFPFIPVRLNNSFLSDSYLPEAYEQVRKAYRRATGARLPDFIAKLEDNESLGDIDYAYIVFGVSLNVVENSCKKYLYAFFDKLRATQVGGPNLYAIWQAAMVDQEAVLATWQEWQAAQGVAENPLNGTVEPPRPGLPGLTSNAIRIASTGSLTTNYNISILWTYIAEDQGAGLGRVGAKVGELWFEDRGADEFLSSVYGGGVLGYSAGGYRSDKIRLYWQRSATSHTYLDIVGLSHNNFIYGDKIVSISGPAALADLEESGFIVPLHYDTWREISLVDSSQMATACVFAVFNCYEIKKQKWWQSSVFAILVTIVIAVISAVFTGGASLGLLGTALSVGTAFGLTGMTAVIVGAITNALAALVLATFLEQLAIGVFGEQLGGIIAAVFMLVLGSALGGLQATGTFALNWGDLLKVDNILAITNAVGNAYAQGVNMDTRALGQNMTDYADQAKRESEKIQQAFFEQFGYGAGKIDPMLFTDLASSTRILAESSDTFLTRTLMTGSEVAEMSRELLYNFAEYSLELPDAYT